MREDKPRDGSGVNGCRTSTTSDIERMSRLKGMSRYFCAQLDIEHDAMMNVVVERFSKEETERNEALRCIEIARTKMQEACMWACRAVARPDADC